MTLCLILLQKITILQLIGAVAQVAVIKFEYHHSSAAKQHGVNFTRYFRLFKAKKTWYGAKLKKIDSKKKKVK